MGETNAGEKYFAFLDALRDRGDVSTVMAPIELIRKYPEWGAVVVLVAVKISVFSL